MKVRDLIDILETMDPDADAFLLVQPSYPFEVHLTGVCQRSDFAEETRDSGEPGGAAVGDRWQLAEADLPGNDVFLLAGDQVRYGNKAAWDAARRR